MHPMVYGGLLRLAIASQGVAVNASGRNVVSFLLRQKGNSTNSPHVFSVIGSAFCPNGPVVYEPEAARRFFTLNATSLDKFLAIQQTDGK